MVRLSTYDYKAFDRGCGGAKRILWHLLGKPLLRCSLLPFSGYRVHLLRLFGAKIGEKVTIKPGVRVTAPWRLTIQDHCWIGEDAWIDNLGQITIENDVCLSQGVYLVTGNHDWTDPAFGIVVKPIVIRQGAWIGARATVTPGRTVGVCAIASAGSVVTKDVGDYQICSGNPAEVQKIRRFRDRSLSAEVHSQLNTAQVPCEIGIRQSSRRELPL